MGTKRLHAGLLVESRAGYIERRVACRMAEESAEASLTHRAKAKSKGLRLRGLKNSVRPRALETEPHDPRACILSWNKLPLQSGLHGLPGKIFTGTGRN